MRITLAELLKGQTPVSLLEILSLEGQRYMARLTLDGQLRLLSDRHGDTLLFRSSWEVQDTLKELPIERTEVVHASAYNEMVGMEPSDIEPLRIRIQGGRSSGTAPDEASGRPL